jgi:hypothetical protein
MSGGMIHVGEFFAVILLHVLAILGLIPAEFLSCSCFARDSGTSAFLWVEYDLAVKDDKVIDILAGNSFFKEQFGLMLRVVVENAICEMKRHRNAGADLNGGYCSEFFRTDDKATFAVGVDNGRVSVIDNEGNTQHMKLIIDDSSSNGITKCNDDEITMVVSNECLKCRSVYWWASRAPIAVELGKLNLRQIPWLPVKLCRLGFSDPVSCCCS